MIIQKKIVPKHPDPLELLLFSLSTLSFSIHFIYKSPKSSFKKANRDAVMLFPPALFFYPYENLNIYSN